MHLMSPLSAAVRICMSEICFLHLGLRMVLVAGMAFSAGSLARPISGAEPARDQITQISVMNALMLGNYQGTTTMETLLQAGNFGLGTLDSLDGELIVLDGQAWQAKSDGSIHRCDRAMLTPFAVVTPFEAEEKFDCPPAGSLEQLEELLKARLPGKDAFVAVRVEGKFQSIFLRAVPRQTPPFRPLAEVVKEQSQWQRTDLIGTLIGIRCPDWVTGIGIPGFHWHFLSQDCQSGGHVFDCQIQSGTVSFDRCRTWTIHLDDSLESSRYDLDQDLSREIQQVERQRGTSPPQRPATHPVPASN